MKNRSIWSWLPWVLKIDLNRKKNSKIRYCESIKFCKLFLKASQFSSENGIKAFAFRFWAESLGLNGLFQIDKFTLPLSWRSIFLVVCKPGYSILEIRRPSLKQETNTRRIVITWGKSKIKIVFHASFLASINNWTANKHHDQKKRCHLLSCLKTLLNLHYCLLISLARYKWWWRSCYTHQWGSSNNWAFDHNSGSDNGL